MKNKPTQPTAEEVAALLDEESDPRMLRAMLLGCMQGVLQIFIDDVRHDLECAADLRASVAVSPADAQRRFVERCSLYEAAIAAADGRVAS